VAIPPFGPADTGSSPLGITGGWYAFGDGYGSNGLPPGLCETGAGFMPSQCSTITFPVPLVMDGGVPLGGPDGGNPGAICVSGTAAQVIPTPQGGDIYGIGLGLDFDDVGGTPRPYDAPAHNIVGFTFTITGIPSVGEVIAQFPTLASEQNDVPHFLVGGDGTYTVHFSDLESGPQVCVCGCPVLPPFDPTLLLSIRFLVATNPDAPVPVNDLCVTELSAIVSE
jgi:hypothetical protein